MAHQTLSFALCLLSLVIFPLSVRPELNYELNRLYDRAPVVTAISVAAPVQETQYGAVADFALPVSHGGLVAGWRFMDPRFPADGPQHTGIDYACIEGEAIHATASGYVFWAGWNGDCGNEVGIQHSNGYTSHYCHLSAFGEFGYVAAGAVIGFCGNTGLSTGAHLHYELRHNGVPVDPTR